MNLFKSMCGNCGFSPHCDAENGSMNTKKPHELSRSKRKKKVSDRRAEKLIKF